MVEDANGNQTRYNYSSGRLTSEYADADKDGVLDEDEANIAYTYDIYGRLTGVTTATTEYVFAYNGANLLQSVAIAGEANPLITYRYNETYNVNTGVTYANGLTIDYVYDILGNVTEVKRNGTAAIEYAYNGNMQVVCEKDYVNNSVIEYQYADGGELYLTEKTQNGIEILEYSDTSVESTSKSITVINGYELDYSSIYDEETETSKFVLPTDAEITFDTDKFERTEKVYLKDSEGNNILTVKYTYVDKTIDGELRTSDRIQSVTYSTNKSYTYTYDAVGNITSVSDGPYITTYEYDELYQLTRENNQKAGKTWAYTYDKSGNILSKAEYAYTAKGVSLGIALDTTSYTYGNEDWGDQLTFYGGTAITYDAQGNPLNWRDGMSFSWTGRQLDSITKSDGAVVSFTYDANGMRTEKIVGDETYGYVWQNGKLIAETYVNGTDSRSIYYIYDENGSPVAWSYLDEYYYYIKNQQGDILGFTDSEGNVVVTYEYDAWGNLLYYTGTSSLAEYNGLRYRGYAYDNETGLYYLQSRYYDPKVGRFLNADDTDYLGASGTVLGYNLYAYCENNPVCCKDLDGQLCVVALPKSYINKNYAYNSKLTFGKYILTQYYGNASKAKMGYYKGSYNGCGWIATYNANSLLGINDHPSNIIKYYEKRGLVLDGLIGISSSDIVSYYKKLGKRVTTGYTTAVKNEISSRVKQVKAAIICYSHSKGLHYITVVWQNYSQKFHIYNYTDYVYTCTSMYAFLSNERAFVAFIGIY